MARYGKKNGNIPKYDIGGYLGGIGAGLGAITTGAYGIDKLRKKDIPSGVIGLVGATGLTGLGGAMSVAQYMNNKWAEERAARLASRVAPWRHKDEPKGPDGEIMRFDSSNTARNWYPPQHAGVPDSTPIYVPLRNGKVYQSTYGELMKWRDHIMPRTPVILGNNALAQYMMGGKNVGYIRPGGIDTEKVLGQYIANNEDDYGALVDAFPELKHITRPAYNNLYQGAFAHFLNDPSQSGYAGPHELPDFSIDNGWQARNFVGYAPIRAQLAEARASRHGGQQANTPNRGFTIRRIPQAPQAPDVSTSSDDTPSAAYGGEVPRYDIGGYLGGVGAGLGSLALGGYGIDKLRNKDKVSGGIGLTGATGLAGLGGYMAINQWLDNKANEVMIAPWKKGKPSNRPWLGEKFRPGEGAGVYRYVPGRDDPRHAPGATDDTPIYVPLRNGKVHKATYKELEKWREAIYPKRMVHGVNLKPGGIDTDELDSQFLFSTYDDPSTLGDAFPELKYITRPAYSDLRKGYYDTFLANPLQRGYSGRHALPNFKVDGGQQGKKFAGYRNTPGFWQKALDWLFPSSDPANTSQEITPLADGGSVPRYGYGGYVGAGVSGLLGAGMGYVGLREGAKGNDGALKAGLTGTALASLLAGGLYSAQRAQNKEEAKAAEALLKIKAIREQNAKLTAGSRAAIKNKMATPFNGSDDEDEPSLKMTNPEHEIDRSLLPQHNIYQVHPDAAPTSFQELLEMHRRWDSGGSRRPSWMTPEMREHLQAGDENWFSRYQIDPEEYANRMLAEVPSDADGGEVPRYAKGGGNTKIVRGDPSNNFNTPIPPERLKEFKEWFKKSKISPRDFHDYDIQGFFLDVTSKHPTVRLAKEPGTGKVFMNDKYKKPNEIRFSDESIYSDYQGPRNSPYSHGQPGHWYLSKDVPPELMKRIHELENKFNPGRRDTEMILDESDTWGGVYVPRWLMDTFPDNFKMRTNLEKDKEGEAATTKTYAEGGYAPRYDVGGVSSGGYDPFADERRKQMLNWQMQMAQQAQMDEQMAMADQDIPMEAHGGQVPRYNPGGELPNPLDGAYGQPAPPGIGDQRAALEPPYDANNPPFRHTDEYDVLKAALKMGSGIALTAGGSLFLPFSLATPVFDNTVGRDKDGNPQRWEAVLASLGAAGLGAGLFSRGYDRMEDWANDFGIPRRAAHQTLNTGVIAGIGNPPVEHQRQRRAADGGRVARHMDGVIPGAMGLASVPRYDLGGMIGGAPIEAALGDTTGDAIGGLGNYGIPETLEKALKKRKMFKIEDVLSQFENGSQNADIGLESILNGQQAGAPSPEVIANAAANNVPVDQDPRIAKWEQIKQRGKDTAKKVGKKVAEEAGSLLGGAVGSVAGPAGSMVGKELGKLIVKAGTAGYSLWKNHKDAVYAEKLRDILKSFEEHQSSMQDKQLAVADMVANAGKNVMATGGARKVKNYGMLADGGEIPRFQGVKVPSYLFGGEEDEEDAKMTNQGAEGVGSGGLNFDKWDPKSGSQSNYYQPFASISGTNSRGGNFVTNDDGTYSYRMSNNPFDLVNKVRNSRTMRHGTGRFLSRAVPFGVGMFHPFAGAAYGTAKSFLGLNPTGLALSGIPLASMIGSMGTGANPLSFNWRDLKDNFSNNMESWALPGIWKKRTGNMFYDAMNVARAATLAAPLLI